MDFFVARGNLALQDKNITVLIENIKSLCYNTFMLKSLENTKVFQNLINDISSPSHAYMFYGEDAELNIQLARVFIASIFCGKPACMECESCRRIALNKNPDLLVIDKDVLQVADIEGLIDNVQLKPMIYKYKVVLIEKADGINEIAQNKLLKTLEEPNPQVIFVLVSTNANKLLPTIKSRVSKHFVPQIDLSEVSEELKLQGINVDKFLHCGITLSDAIRYTTSNNDAIIPTLESTIYGLKTSADIPNIVGKLKLPTEQRKEFLRLFINAINCALTSQWGVFSKEFIVYLQMNFKPILLVKMLDLTDKASRKLDANVNFNYVLDDLFYNILKEKYLCK